jgi:hypothetical protein
VSHLESVQVSLRTNRGGGTQNVLPFLALVRTSDAQIPKVLFGALRVIAGSTSSLVRAHGLLGINLVTEGCGQEASCNILRECGVVTIGLEHAKRTLIRSELDRFNYIVSRGHLFQLVRLEDERWTYRFWCRCRCRFWLQLWC